MDVLLSEDVVDVKGDYVVLVTQSGPFPTRRYIGATQLPVRHNCERLGMQTQSWKPVNAEESLAHTAPFFSSTCFINKVTPNKGCAQVLSRCKCTEAQ